MIPKSGYRFSEKIMRKTTATLPALSWGSMPGQVRRGPETPDEQWKARFDRGAAPPPADHRPESHRGCVRARGTQTRGSAKGDRRGSAAARGPAAARAVARGAGGCV